MTANAPLWAANIEERLTDEKNVVTYKWLSRAASVPVNVAKQMLHSYLKNYASKHPEGIEVIYLLGGVQSVNGASDQYTPNKKYSFRLTEDSTLEQCRKSFDTITTEHIYSLQLVTPKDIKNVLYHVDMSKSLPNWTESNKWSSIKCSLAKKLSDVSINYSDSSGAGGTLGSSAALVEKDHRPKGKATSAVSFFGTLHSKAKEEASKKKTEKKTRGKLTGAEQKITTTNSTSKDSAALAPNQTPKPKRKNVIEDDDDDDDESSAIEAVSKVSTTKTEKERNATEVQKKSRKPEKNNSNVESTEDVPQDAKKDGKDGKKRKAAETAGEPEQTIKSNPQQPSITAHTTNTSAGAPGQKRTRKVVKKVKKCYQGPGGYMITDTVDVEEEIEISEEEFQRLNAPKASTLPKKDSGSIVKKKKQASMMSFFSKKK